MNEENGGQAFPMPAHKKEFGPGLHPLYCNAEPGMTLRDYFAAKAMQAVPMQQCHLHDIEAIYDRIASHAYKMADAMLKSRAE